MSDQERVPILLTREQADDLLAGIEQDVNTHAFWADVSMMEFRRDKHARIAATYTAIAAHLRAQRGDAGEGEVGE